MNLREYSLLMEDINNQNPDKGWDKELDSEIRFFHFFRFKKYVNHYPYDFLRRLTEWCEANVDKRNFKIQHIEPITNNSPRGKFLPNTRVYFFGE